MKVIESVVIGLAGLLAMSATLRAEDKNGVSLVVIKKTLERSDMRTPGYYYGDRIDRTQGLKATIRNTSVKPQPEGEVKWTILVRRYNYTSTELPGTTGTEKLKGLKPSESVEMVVGAAQITGYSGYDMAKDKIEYQIIVSQEGAEKVRVQSTPGFDALLKRAQISKSEGGEKSTKNSQKSAEKTTPAATPKPVAAATPRPAAKMPANPFAAPRATPAPTPKPSADADAPLDGGKLK